jgi:protein SCO1/2
MKAFNWKLGLLIVLATAGLVFLGYRVWKNQPSDKFLSASTKAPDFAFKDQTGQLFSSGQLKGKVWVVDFIFSRCLGQCPMLSHWFLDLQRDWKQNPDFKLVTFTVDPDYDTVAVFRQYANDFQADDNQWHFLSGPKDQIYTVIQKGFRLTAQSDPQGTPGFQFIHTTRLLLIDANGMVRGMYDGQEGEEVDKLKKDIRYLMNSRTKS